MLCAKRFAHTADDRRIAQPHQSHGRTRPSGIAVFLDIAGEQGILPVGRNMPAIDVPPLLGVDQFS